MNGSQRGLATAADRFLPNSQSPLPISDHFRTMKESHKLSTPERLLRHQDATPDPFVFRSPCPKPDTVTVSGGTIWSVGGTAPGSMAIDGGRGQYMSSGTNAPLYSMPFSALRPRSEERQEKHEGRLAQALNMNRVQRVIHHHGSSTFQPRRRRNKCRASRNVSRTTWTGSEWSNDKHLPKKRVKKQRTIPNPPFRVLDAPGLRDDFYCSIMAYSPTCNILAIGLGNLLYGWSEPTGTSLLNPGVRDGSWLTSVAFSSTEGGKSILAYGRSNGYIGLLSLFDSMIPRFEAAHPHPVSCMSWRPVTTMRPSLNPFNSGVPAYTEDLLVGEEAGDEVARDTWHGSMSLLARVKVHAQQICGLAWSPDGEMFVTGGNDNMCCLFRAEKILVPRVKTWHASAALHCWPHLAAVKAIAFCPWRPHLLATGGGSNDKMIHFYHSTSGTTLATISVSAQVTSLVWSTTRREIAATFGYAQPDHAIRIAVFSWPDCQMVASVKWDGEHRALYAVPYPGNLSPTSHTQSDNSESRAHRQRQSSRGLRDRRSRKGKGGMAEGCLIVAASDKSEVDSGVGTGIMGGSDIIEMTEGIDKEGDIIR
ncbi:WD40-repeat-containing domain protein [Truncatella angustata]|uniref:WD40-repeat-containing domain protein n=1 Tax=Truncatella angustata TaxID=152316 RepID=A0A9P8REY8_9PEZI|nr:WD40-repeat-containing domain protein [Truncatella angustata]KAH6640049.1 WD40-repeat-containing domain protein [Truncatella angustata]